MELKESVKKEQFWSSKFPDMKAIACPHAQIFKIL